MAQAKNSQSTIVRTERGLTIDRFLTLPKKKRMESVKRHQLWQSQLKKDEFFNKVFNE